MQQPSVKDEFNNSSYPTGADYSLQNLDSYYKTNSSATPSESPSSSQQNQENQQPAPTIVKSDKKRWSQLIGRLSAQSPSFIS